MTVAWPLGRICYGLQKNGAFVNPLREHRNMPPGDPVPASELDEFARERRRHCRSFRGSRNQQLIFPRSARSLAGVTGWIADNGVRFPRSNGSPAQSAGKTLR